MSGERTGAATPGDRNDHHLAIGTGGQGVRQWMRATRYHSASRNSHGDAPAEPCEKFGLGTSHHALTPSRPCVPSTLLPHSDTILSAKVFK